MSNITKIIDILDPQTQTVKETVIERQPEKTELLQEALRNFNSTVLGKTGYSTFAEADRDGFKKIREAAATTSDFPTLLRTGLKQILFASYDEEPETYTQWVYQEPSDKQAEDWVEEPTGYALSCRKDNPTPK